jgi:hypothetical protein
MRCPVLRRRDSHSGFCTELEKLDGGENTHEMVDVADLFGGVDVDPDGHASSLICRNIPFTSVSRSLPE